MPVPSLWRSVAVTLVCAAPRAAQLRSASAPAPSVHPRGDFTARALRTGMPAIEPDFPEHKEERAFLWGTHGYGISLGASDLLLVPAAPEVFAPSAEPIGGSASPPGAS